MTTDRPAITPAMRVGDFLSAFPELEPLLVAQAPAFANLKNPVLRRTVAKVATLAQAARVGGVDARELVRVLRSVAGQEVVARDEEPGQDATAGAAPAWYADQRVAAVVDADAILASGEHPLGATQRHVASLGCHDIVCVDAGFVPAPLVDAFRQQGFEVETFPLPGGRFRTAITRNQSPTARTSQDPCP